MRAVKITAAVFLSAVGVVAADSWVLLNSYATPPNLKDCDALGTETFRFLCDGTPPYVYAWNYGSIVASFAAPGGPGAWGLSLVLGTTYLVGNRNTSWIYRCTTAGSVLGSFLCPYAGPGGLKWRYGDGNVYATIPDQNLIAVFTTTGSLVSTLAGPASKPYSCGGYSSFYVGDADTNTIYENGVPVITSIDTPTGLDVVAITRGPYEVHMAVADAATNRIYIYQNVTNDVLPASLGRVKVLYK